MRNYFKPGMVLHLDEMELLFDYFEHAMMQFVEKKMLMDNFKPDAGLHDPFLLLANMRVNLGLLERYSDQADVGGAGGGASQELHRLAPRHTQF